MPQLVEPVLLDEPVGCPEPARRAEQWFDRVELPYQEIEQLRLIGGGLVVADFDGDGRPELFAPGRSTRQLWFLAADGSFDDRAAQWLGDIDLERAVGGSAADYDGDGDLDLFVTRDGEVDRLLRNEGDRFSDASLEAGLPPHARRSMSSAWADFDADGDLDLVTGSYASDEETPLYRNLGDGTFDEATALFPADVHAGYTFMTAWYDLEDDGYPDLFLPNDYTANHAPTMLLANRGGAFEVDEDAGYHARFDGMGLTLADIDGDTLPDAVETTIMRATLLLSLPDAESLQGIVYYDAGASRGLTFGGDGSGRIFGWGVDVGDLDHDGDHDIAMGFGAWVAGFEEVTEQADAIWLQQDGMFVESDLGRDVLATRGLLLVDLNRDGWLDIVKRTLDGPTLVDLSRCGEGAFLQVALRAPPPNTYGLGAKVVATLPDGSRAVRVLEAGSRSMFAGGPPEVHFGLGDLDVLPSLEVRWPDGSSTAFSDVPTRRRVTVVLPGGDIP